MRLEYSTREGNFDFAHPSEISYSTHMVVYDEEGKKLIHCNISPESDIEGNDPEEAIWYIKDQIQRVWSTANKERQAMVDYLKEHSEEIEKGNDKYELIQVNQRIEELTARKERLEGRI